MSKKKKADPNSPFAALAELRDALKDREQGPSKESQKQAQKQRNKQAQQDALESLSFSRLMAGVDKLAPSKKHRVPTNGPDPGAHFREQKQEQFRSLEEIEAEAAMEQLRHLTMGGVRFEVSDDGGFVEGRRIEVSPALLRRLRRGQFPIDARIDLHGKTLEQAREDLCEFLGRMRARGEAVVLVVHGKGEHSPRGAGVLRGEIAAWLSQGAAAQHCAAFATAQRDDGGEGATYVLLLRR